MTLDPIKSGIARMGKIKPTAARCMPHGPSQLEGSMIRSLVASVVLTSMALTPVQPASAQDALGGALLGGALGAIVGGR
jgi:hypothetical protein